MPKASGRCALVHQSMRRVLTAPARSAALTRGFGSVQGIRHAPARHLHGAVVSLVLINAFSDYRSLS
jgi:hypothetical protein